MTEARREGRQINVNADDAGFAGGSSSRRRANCPGAVAPAGGDARTIRTSSPTRTSCELQAQLEGTENRITVARERYITAVQDYNTYIRQFPQNLTAKMFGYKAKPNFTVENEAQIQDAPKVDFGRRRHSRSNNRRSSSRHRRTVDRGRSGVAS